MEGREQVRWVSGNGWMLDGGERVDHLFAGALDFFFCRSFIRLFVDSLVCSRTIVDR